MRRKICLVSMIVLLAASSIGMIESGSHRGELEKAGNVFL